MKKIKLLFFLVIVTTKIYGSDTTSNVRFSTIKSLNGTKNWEGMKVQALKQILVSMDSLINAGNAQSDDYFNRGVLKNTLEDYSGAMDDYNKAIAIDAKSYNPLVNRSVLLMAQKNIQKHLLI